MRKRLWARTRSQVEAGQMDERMVVFADLLQLEDVRGFYNRKGRRIGAGKWLALHGDREYQTLAMTAVAGLGPWPVVVSTSWYGVRVRVDGIDSRVLFETGVIGMGDEVNQKQRWGSEGEARIGHRATVVEVMKTNHESYIMDQLIN